MKRLQFPPLNQHFTVAVDRGQILHNVIVDVDVVRETVKQHDCHSINRSRVVVGDSQGSSVHVLYRSQLWQCVWKVVSLDFARRNGKRSLTLDRAPIKQHVYISANDHFKVRVMIDRDSLECAQVWR